MILSLMYFVICLANYSFTARKRGADNLVKEKDQNSKEKRFQNQLKTLWKPQSNLLLCTKDLLTTKWKRFLGVSELQKNATITSEKRSQDHLETLWRHQKNTALVLLWL